MANTSTDGTAQKPNMRPTSATGEKNPDSLQGVEGDEALAAYVSRCYDQASGSQQTAFTLFRDLYRLWRFYKARGSAVKVQNPIAFALTQGLLAKVFVRPPKVMVTARGGGYSIEAKIVSSLLDYQFNNPDADFPMEEQFISFLTELFVCGTAVAKVCWQTDFVTKFEQQPDIDEKTGQQKLDKQGNPVFKRVKVASKGFDDAVFEHVPIENFYKDPASISIEGARWVIFEKWVDKDYLLEQQEANLFHGVDDLIAASQAKGDVSGVSNARQYKGGGSSNSQKYKNKFHLLEYWEDDRVVVVVDEEHVVRDEDNPFDHGRKPFVSMPYVRVPHEFYGVGALEPAADIQRAINISLTQRLEFVANTLNQQFAVLAGRNVDEDAIIDGYPIVHMDSADAVEPLNKGIVQQAAFVNNQELVGDMERTMGVSGYDTGTPNSASDKTAGTKGGIEAIINEAQGRFSLTLARFEKIVLRKTAQLFLDLDIQYLPETEEKLVDIMDSNNQQQSYPATKDVLTSAKWHVIIVPGSTGAIDRAKKFQDFMTWVTASAGMLPNFDKEAAMIEAAHLQEIDQPERFIKPSQPTPPPAPEPSMSMNFKDLPPEGQIQMAQKVGITIGHPDIMEQALQQHASSLTPNQPPQPVMPPGPGGAQ